MTGMAMKGSNELDHEEIKTPPSRVGATKGLELEKVDEVSLEFISIS